MNKRVNQRFDEPSVDGPDYVALVIEWEQTAIPDALEDQLTTPTQVRATWRDKLRPVFARVAEVPLAWKAAAGIVGALVVASWGIHRLREA